MQRARCEVAPPGSRNLRDLHPVVERAARAFISALGKAGFRVTVTSTLRDNDSQAVLYRNWINGCSRYPAAKPGHSMHNLGVAFDLHLDPPNYALAGAVWEALGGTWGGRFNDPIHFDVRPRK